jgi:hypothetical protein
MPDSFKVLSQDPVGTAGQYEEPFLTPTRRIGVDVAVSKDSDGEESRRLLELILTELQSLNANIMTMLAGQR